ncbi:MAG: mechanosensitive ion channel family protein [Candidatus Zixiibacteriota bacterium]|nr:MAG: mechanosensitive ion channel family protein [candidate division Zixibacteria bacterium]
MIEVIISRLRELGLEIQYAEPLGWIAGIACIILLALLGNFIVKKILLRILHFVVRGSRSDWDDILLKRKVFHRLANLAPALVIYFAAPIFPAAQDWIQRIILSGMAIILLVSLNAFSNAVIDIYNRYDISRERPIKGAVQIIMILIYTLGAVFIIATLMNRSPWVLLSGIGAMTAILLLIFKDSILGFIAGMQLSANKMVRLGDWIEMPKLGADGDVIDITLTTVKVQNWDKTISTIPTYALITDSFKNWRGMTESGGRRIKRAIYIDMSSIKFCAPEMLDKFEKIHFLRGYIKNKRKEIDEYNLAHNVDTSTLVNGRNLTNIGTLRAYIAAYLKNHPQISQNMTFLIRHLQPTPTGLPIEIYVFSSDQEWARYEGIQADIFDHILAVIPEFDLRVFQNPSGSDFKAMAGYKDISAGD